MKTLTEFSALVLRKAADARAKAPAAPTPAQAPAAPPVEAASSEPTAADQAQSAEPAADQAQSAEPAADQAQSAEPAAEGEAGEAASAEPTASAAPAVADPAVDFVANELGVQPDRAARLLEALDIIGNRMDEVRLVRVYQGEKGPHNAVSRGEFHYAIDKVAGAPKRDRGGRDRGDRRGGGGGGGGPGGGGGGFGGRGGRDKPRGLGSLKIGAAKEDKDPNDDRPGRGEMPRAGIGWQLTAAPRDFGGGGPGRGRGGPKRGRGPGRPGDDRGPRGPRDDRGRGPGGPGGPRGPRAPRPEGQMHAGGERTHDQLNEHRPARPQGGPPPGPRMGPDGQPLPPREKRPRKPMGPDANGLGPDGTPWDPERRTKRQAERDETRTPEGQPVNTPPVAAVEAEPPSKSE